MLSLLNRMGLPKRNPDLLIVGILFNTIEDVDATIDMIYQRFGERLIGKHAVILTAG